MSKSDARYWSRAWARLRALCILRKNDFQWTKDIDKNSKQLKDNNGQLSHINCCPVPRQRHQTQYHDRFPGFPHFACQQWSWQFCGRDKSSAINRARGTCWVRACALARDGARLTEIPVVYYLHYIYHATSINHTWKDVEFFWAL